MGSFDPLYYVIAIIIGTIIVTLVLYIAVLLIESRQRAKDKVFMIIIIALITVIVLPIILGAIGYVFEGLGNVLVSIRYAIDQRGYNHMIYMVPIFGFLILLAVNKYLLDISWESALWITLILLFVLFLMFTILPELEQNFIGNPLTG
ncbi:MAG: hypothetical protein ACFFBP_16670 [Promethearchaeota archaeon]